MVQLAFLDHEIQEYLGGKPQLLAFQMDRMPRSS
jgi:hypothetical protein